MPLITGGGGGYFMPLITGGGGVLHALDHRQHGRVQAALLEGLHGAGGIEARHPDGKLPPHGVHLHYTLRSPPFHVYISSCRLVLLDCGSCLPPSLLSTPLGTPPPPSSGCDILYQRGAAILRFQKGLSRYHQVPPFQRWEGS